MFKWKVPDESKPTGFETTIYFDTLAGFSTYVSSVDEKVEEHGKIIDEHPGEIFADSSFVSDTVYELGLDEECDLSLTSTTEARNSGIVLPNINNYNALVLGEKLDLGANDYDRPDQPWKRSFWPRQVN